MDNTSRLSDAQLMESTRDGDLSGLVLLFQRHHRDLYAFFRRVGVSPASSEDLTQEVFLRLLRYRHAFRKSRSFRAWLYTMARHLLADHRSKRPVPRLEDADGRAGDASHPGALLEAAERRTSLRHALKQLPVEQREVLVLSRYHGLKYEEIGEILGCSPGAVKQRAYRALRRLARVLESRRQGAPS